MKKPFLPDRCPKCGHPLGDGVCWNARCVGTPSQEFNRFLATQHRAKKLYNQKTNFMSATEAMKQTLQESGEL